MTTLEQLQALADQELIERLAVEVMGWRLKYEQRVRAGGGFFWAADGGKGDKTHYRFCWNPLTDWNHTMQVVERLHEKFGFVQFSWFDPPHEFSLAHSIHHGGNVNRHTLYEKKNPRRAICLAALLAVA